MAETRRLKLTLECVVVNVGPSSRMTVTRNAKGKVTLTIAKGLREADRDGEVAAIEKLLKDSG